MNIEKLNFSVRTYNCLRRAGIDSVEELQQFVKRNGYDGLKVIRNLRTRSVEEIKEKLADDDIVSLHIYKKQRELERLKKAVSSLSAHCDWLMEPPSCESGRCYEIARNIQYAIDMMKKKIEELEKDSA